MTITELLRSHVFRGIIIGVFAVLILVLTFAAGVAVGEQRASFAQRWVETYHSNFGGPRNGFIPDMQGPEFANPNTTFGKIVRIALPAITVSSADGEKTVTITDDTIIRQFRDDIPASTLVVGDQVVVIGSPNAQAQIEATFIRVMPPPSPSGRPSPTPAR